MRIGVILLGLTLIPAPRGCREDRGGPRVTVTEVDSSGRLPEHVDPDIYAVGRLILQRQEEATQRIRDLSQRFTAMGDTTSTNER